MRLMQKAVHLSGPYDLSIKEVQIPKVAEDQVLAKVKATGICGSDAECYTGHSKEGRYDIAPYVPGHEWSGEVVDAGRSVKSIKPGDRVTSDCLLGCGSCESCKAGLPPCSCQRMREVGFFPNTPGAMAEYLLMEERFVHKLGEEMSYEEGVLVEPCAVAYCGIWDQGGCVDASDDVVIFGAGPIGLFALVICKVAGAKAMVVEPIKFRRQMATKVGADEVVDSKTENLKEKVLAFSKGKGASLVMEASGDDEALANCFEVAGGSARIRLIGHSVGRKVPVEIGLTIWKGLFIHGQSDSPFFVPRTIKFMSRAKNRIDYSQIITHRFSLEKVQEAFDLATKRDESVKIILSIS